VFEWTRDPIPRPEPLHANALEGLPRRRHPADPAPRVLAE